MFYFPFSRATVLAVIDGNLTRWRRSLLHEHPKAHCLVELKCDSRNQRSQQAIARLGATREGLFRKHMFVRDNYLRDTVYFSIIAEEWPAIRERLQQP